MAENIGGNSFSFNYKSVIIDEIALNGLEGIGFDYLWKRTEKRLNCSLTPKIKCKFWKFITSTKCITFYKLASPVPLLEILDRFSIIDENSGQLLDPPEYLDGPYEYCPIEYEYGSCANYKTRKIIPQEKLQSKSYEEVFELYGHRLVMVASLEERMHALAPHMPMSILLYLTALHYCLLELVGKGRENGQMTVGNTNVGKIVKEPKFLFYNRKHLQDLDLVRVRCLTQVIAEKGTKSLILRLTRFHQPDILSQPKLGKIFDLTQYLMNQPKFSERNEVIIRKGFLTPQQSKRLQKTVNIFDFDDREGLKKKCITLISQSDESSQSEDESPEPTLQCQYKVGVGLLRQAYERFLDAGLKGLTQIEIAQLLGVEFYTSRTICRIFKLKNIVQEFLEDKGRQRTARYIAVAATNEINFKYAEEKKQLMEYLNKNRKRCISEEDKGIPEKRAKHDVDTDSIDKKIIELKVLDGLEEHCNKSLQNAKKKPTLRQLKFATGILKVIKDRCFVTGYQTLSTFVNKETGEPPMDTKSLKLVIQKLMTDGHLKVFKLKFSCQDKERYSLFICSPNIKKTDPLVKSHYNDICHKAKLNYKNPIRKSSQIITRPLANFTYPRYLKIQKLHEHIISVVHFSDMKFNFAPGFTSLHYIIPEMTVELALGNMTFAGETNNIGQLKLQALEQKIRDAPDSLKNNLLYSKNLHNSIRNSLKMLAVLGLVQLINEPSSCVTDDGVYVNFVFYVNRHAKILDTSGVWPRTNENAATLEKSYFFKTFDDVINYWNDVQVISLNTSITGLKREKYKGVYPLRDEAEVVQHDNGNRYGDGLGPCGFDSSIFMDIPRLWRTYCSRNYNTNIANLLKPHIKYRKGCKPGPKEEGKKVIRRRRKLNKPPPKPKPVDIQPVKRPRNDAAVKWTKLDDQILTLLKIVIIIMSPVPGCIKVRNLVAKTLLSAIGPTKAASLCHRRSAHLESNPELMHEKMCIINELRRRPHLTQKYEGLLKVLRLRHHANLLKFVRESKIPIMELLWIVYQIAKNKPYLHRIPCVASNLEEFNKSFTITATATQKINSMYKSSIGTDPTLASLKEGIVLTIMTSIDEENTKETANKIYSIFKNYPETHLRATIEELRKCGAIAAREKIFNTYLNKVHINDIVQSCYKISFSYKRRWINRLCSQFDEKLYAIINDEIPQNGLKGSPTVNCIFFEMHTTGILDIITVNVPVIIGSTGSLIQEEKLNIIDMEAKYKLKSGLVGCKNISKLKTFSELYQTCKFEEHCANLERYNQVNYNIEDSKKQPKDQIIVYLQGKKEYGCTFSELQNITNSDRKWLMVKLQHLEEKEVIKRVGFYENKVVLKEFAKPWLLEINENIYILPTPWLDLEGKLRRNIFMKWCSVIMNKIFECPGSSLEFLSNLFEFITTRAVQDVCMFLEKCECLTLKCLSNASVDLFSDDDVAPEMLDFNPYDPPQTILAFPLKNSLTTFSYIKNKIYKATLNVQNV
ncbi:uncharacterized protein LOC123698979 [Colias croceus]|uniref:uncharacterized protein LOC123698979 n=1 Tax=Colias crocea TaxID=72248 RepID=UPI001E27AE9F|nr:uncharacterized protein LOC123698979 [Colias croceus]